MQDRMFRVIVLGGIGLVGGCGGKVVVDTGVSGATASGAGGSSTSATDGAGGFPQEGPGPSVTVGVTGTGGSLVADAGRGGAGGFPQEAPPPPPAEDAGFPQEA